MVPGGGSVGEVVGEEGCKGWGEFAAADALVIDVELGEQGLVPLAA